MREVKKKFIAGLNEAQLFNSVTLVNSQLSTEESVWRLKPQVGNA